MSPSPGRSGQSARDHRLSGGVVHSMVLGGLMIFIGLLALLAPSRHALLELWPRGLVEVMHPTQDRERQRDLYEPLGNSREGKILLRRDVRSGYGAQWLAAGDYESWARPLSAAVIEDVAGHRYFGYLAGVRDAENGELLPDPRPWLDADWHEYRLGGAISEILVRFPDGSVQALPVSEVIRHYRVNRMNLGARGRLFLRRLLQRWRVPDAAPAPVAAQAEAPASVPSGSSD